LTGARWPLELQEPPANRSFAAPIPILESRRTFAPARRLQLDRKLTVGFYATIARKLAFRAIALQCELPSGIHSHLLCLASPIPRTRLYSGEAQRRLGYANLLRADKHSVQPCVENEGPFISIKGQSHASHANRDHGRAV